MKDGRLIQHAAPSELLAQPADDFVRGFVGTDRALKALRLSTVREVMEHSPPSVVLAESLSAARQTMDALGRSYLPVVDVEGVFFGWIGRDIADGDSVARVGERLTPFAVLGSPGMPLNEALALMFESATGNLAIVDPDRRLVGVVTFDRLFEQLKRADAGRAAAGAAT